MNDEQETKPKEFSYLMVFAILPAIVIVVVIAAWMAISFFMDKNEYESDETRGDDVFDTGMLIEPAEQWRLGIAPKLIRDVDEDAMYSIKPIHHQS